MAKPELDYKEVEKFWDNRSNFSDIQQNAAMTLQSPIFADYRNLTEKRHLFRLISLNENMTVLDIGCGNGRWSIDFAKSCSYVLGIDISENLLNIAQNRSEKEGINNVDYVRSSAVDFCSDQKFDIIHIGGVLIYLNDEDVQKVLRNCFKMLKDNGTLILRESISLRDKYLLNEFSSKKDIKYSAIYRLPQEYIRWAESSGFSLLYNKDTYPVVIPCFICRRISKIGIKRILNTPHFKRLLWGSLIFQAYLDPLLLKIDILTSIYHRKKKQMGITNLQQYFIFSKNLS